jgi:hypothetical protein
LSDIGDHSSSIAGTAKAGSPPATQASNSMSLRRGPGVWAFQSARVLGYAAAGLVAAATTAPLSRCATGG